jgi:hypothetical protein
MIKKTMLLVTAVMIAASSATYAAKSIKVTNEGDIPYFYKVGKTIKKIAPGSTKSFPLKGLKIVKIQAATSKSGNAIKGDKVVFEKLTISQAKANPFVQTNPVTGQATDLSN